jgi:tRNA threonylcarbamoyl adenosine modification protein YeaZ
MLILSVDTALGQESCAITKDGVVLAFSQGDGDSLQAEQLFNHINGALTDAKLKFEDIDHFAADIGPGSFTGIRIGLSAVLAIAFAQNKPFVGVSSLEALAEKVSVNGKNISVAINAGRDEAYFQEFIDLRATTDAKLVALADIKEATAGNIAVCKTKTTPDARDIGITAYRMITNNIADFNRKTPIYIRAPDAKIKVI